MVLHHFGFAGRGTIGKPRPIPNRTSTFLRSTLWIALTRSLPPLYVLLPEEQPLGRPGLRRECSVALTSSAVQHCLSEKQLRRHCGFGRSRWRSKGTRRAARGVASSVVAEKGVLSTVLQCRRHEPVCSLRYWRELAVRQPVSIIYIYRRLHLPLWQSSGEPFVEVFECLSGCSHEFGGISGAGVHL